MSSLDQAQDDDKAASRVAGERIEAEVLELVPELRYVTDNTAEWHDARVADLLTPCENVLFLSTSLLEAGTPVEIKAAQHRLNGQRRGRFLFRRAQHERLLEANAHYLLAVYNPSGNDVISMAVVPASIVDELLPDQWVLVDRNQRQSPEGQAQIAWSRFIDPAEVNA